MTWLMTLFIAPRGGRLRAGWRLATGFVAMLVAVGALVAAVDAVEIPWVESFLWQVLAAPVLTGLAWILAKKVDRRTFPAYGLAWRPARLAAGTGLAFGLVSILYFVLLSSGQVEAGAPWHNRYDVPFLAGLLGFAARYASVALFEELFHRGFLITNLAEGLGGQRPRAGMASVLSSVLFGLLHLTNEDATPLGALNVALLGLLFGLFYVRTGDLCWSIGLHFGWNFALGPCYGLAVSGYEPRVSLVLSEVSGAPVWTGGGFGPEASLLATGLLLVVLIIAGVAMRPERNREGAMP